MAWSIIWPLLCFILIPNPNAAYSAAKSGRKKHNGEHYPWKYGPYPDNKHRPWEYVAYPGDEEHSREYAPHPHKERHPKDYKPNPDNEHHPKEYVQYPEDKNYPSEYVTYSENKLHPRDYTQYPKDEQHPREYKPHPHKKQHPTEYVRYTDEQYPREHASYPEDEQRAREYVHYPHNEQYPADSKPYPDTDVYPEEYGPHPDHRFEDGKEERETCSFNSPYRTYDGSCNNVKDWGKADEPMARLMRPDYSDGIDAPRAYSVVGHRVPLPNPRHVSLVIHPDHETPTNHTLFVMTWGQFIDHEIASTPNPIEVTRNELHCCGPNGSPEPYNYTSDCFPIWISPRDDDFRRVCMDVQRSVAAKDEHGKTIYPRETMNIVTSFIDASNVYGSSYELSEELRMRDPAHRHLLITTPDDFPPDNGKDDCTKRDSSDICFLTGDDRVNEQPTLVLLHVVFLRYHNILAHQLAHVGNGVDKERVFQQARAIVAAVMQNILHSEYLPLVLAPSIMRQYDLELRHAERTRNDPRHYDARVFNSFATAAFRYGHSQIPHFIPMGGRHVPMHELFFKPYEVRRHMDSLTENLLRMSDEKDCSQFVDPFFAEDVTKKLFEEDDKIGLGFDLIALNIHRGRDHGIPSYNNFREELGMRKIRSFRDPELGPAGYRLSKIYRHVDDIDLFTGGMVELPYDRGIVGETFSRLIALQFQGLRYGDRFFFDSKYSHFSDDQVDALKQIHLSHVLCLTTRITHAQPNAFKGPLVPGNSPVDCRRLLREHPPMEIFRSFPYVG